MATALNLTTGVVYVVGWSGTISGANLSLTGQLCIGDGTTVIKQVGTNDLGIYTGATACAGGALCFDVSATAVTSGVPVLFPNGTAAAPSLTFSAQTNTGFFRPSNNILGVAVAGVETVEFRPSTGTGVVADDGDIALRNAGEIHWMGASQAAGSSRAITMDTANRWRFDAGANYFSGYSLLTGSNTGLHVNGSGILQVVGGSATDILLLQHTGAAGYGAIYTAGGADLQLGVNNTQQWKFADSVGTFLAIADNAIDIGAVASGRPRTLYTATSLVSPTHNATTAYQIGAALLVSATAPTVSAGFGSTSAGTVTFNTGTCAVVVTVGTNAGGTTGTITFPVAPHGWAVVLQDTTNTADLTRQTGYTTTTATFSTTVAWTTGDILVGIAVPF